MFTKLFPTTLIAAGLLSLSHVNAQNEQQPPTKTDKRDVTPQDPTGAARNSANDGILAAWLLAENENEVALARFAQQRAQDPEVKAFAQKMIDDHQQFADKLRPHAAPGVAGLEKTPAAPPPTGDRNTTDASGMRQPVGTLGSLDHVALVRDLSRKCLETAKRELEPKQGADFDRCYTFMAVGAHMHAADTMEVFRNYSSDKLGAVISEGEKTVKMHLDHAKQLAKKLEGKSGSPSDLDKKDKKDKHDKDPIEGTNPPPPRKK